MTENVNTENGPKTYRLTRFKRGQVEYRRCLSFQLTVYPCFSYRGREGHMTNPKVFVVLTVTFISLTAGFSTSGCRGRLGHPCRLQCCHSSSRTYGCWFSLNATGNGLSPLLCVSLNSSQNIATNRTERFTASIERKDDLCIRLDIDPWTSNDTTYICHLGSQLSQVKITVDDIQIVVTPATPVFLTNTLDSSNVFLGAAVFIVFVSLVVFSLAGQIVMERYSSLERSGFWLVPTESTPPPSSVSLCLWSLTASCWGPRRWLKADIVDTAPGCTLHKGTEVPDGIEGRFTPISV